MAMASKPSGQAWAHVAPHLDEAIAGLRPAERAAVVLRFLERRSMAEVGQAMGVSEHAAQMRVSRALEKLRQFFARRGVAMTATVLGVVVAAHATEAAPAAVVESLSLASLKSANVAPGPTAKLADGAARDLAVGQARGMAAFAAAATLVVALGLLSLRSGGAPDRPAPARDTPAVIGAIVR